MGPKNVQKCLNILSIVIYIYGQQWVLFSTHKYLEIAVIRFVQCDHCPIAYKYIFPSLSITFI